MNAKVARAPRQTIARWFALLWAGAVVSVVPHLPMYSGVTASADGRTFTTTRSLVEVNGTWPVYRVVLIPLAAATLALLPLQGRYRRLAGLVAALIAGCAMLAAIASVGVFFVPAVAALAYAALRDRQVRGETGRDTQDGPG